MIKTMNVPILYRVRGIDAKGINRHSRVYQRSTSAVRFADLLDRYGFVVKIEKAHDISFETVIGGELR